MSGSVAARELIYAFVTGSISTQEFSESFVRIWREMRESTQAKSENEYFNRGMNIIFTAIDSLDSDVERCAKQERVQELLLAEVRAVYAVLWG